MFSAKDFLQLAINIVGTVQKLTIDTGIYNHCEGFVNLDSDSGHDIFDLDNDIFVVVPKRTKYIELEDLLRVVKHTDKQFENVRCFAGGRSYYYEGLVPDRKKHKYVIHWGS